MKSASTYESAVLWDNDYWEKVRQRTLKVIACIPPDKYDWRYAEGKFSFADIIRHLATIERYMYAENVQLKPSRYPGHGPELADGPENVMSFFNRLHQESVAIFNGLSADDLQKKCITPGGAPITVWKWLRAMVEHEVHHRAQIYVYLGMLGIPTPPIYGLTSEEVRERSGKPVFSIWYLAVRLERHRIWRFLGSLTQAKYQVLNTKYRDHAHRLPHN